MTSPFSVNLYMTVGHDFAQEFYMANPDKTAMDITGVKFTGQIMKHPGAIDAVETEIAGRPGAEVDNIVYKYIPMEVFVKSGVHGIYTVTVAGSCTRHWQQGKYFYNVTMKDINGYRTQVLNGLVFLDYGSSI